RSPGRAAEPQAIGQIAGTGELMTNYTAAFTALLLSANGCATPTGELPADGPLTRQLLVVRCGAADCRVTRGSENFGEGAFLVFDDHLGAAISEVTDAEHHLAK